MSTTVAKTVGLGFSLAHTKPLTGSIQLDRIFISAPLWIPLIFFFLYQNFPAYEAMIFLASMTLFGETHFGATWAFFIDRQNRTFLQENKMKLILIPVTIVVAMVGIAFLHSLSLAMFISSVISGFHVTRQSVGILKLYGERDSKYLKWGEWAIYAASFWFLFVGFLRFYSPYKPVGLEQIIWLLSGVILVAGVIFTFVKGKAQSGFSIDTILALLTGMLLYSPYLFVARTEHAVSMGVGMHFMQYIALTGMIYSRKAVVQNQSFLISGKMQFFCAIAVYALAMLYFRTFTGGINSFEVGWLFLIPLCLQTVHYYVDMFIWRFSNPHIRQSVGKYLHPIS